MQTKELLRVEDLQKNFHLKGNHILKAVDRVSFTLRKGETLGLVGESGCGKTTVGRTLLKIYQPDGGKIFYEGRDITKTGRKEQLELCKKMQMIFQDPYSSLNPFMTVGEIISEGLDIHGIGSTREERSEIMHALLKQVGLHHSHANRFPHEFSGGQRQRVGIARALAVNPEFIVCDEAISALDVSVQAQIVNLLLDLREQRDLSYLFISHDLSVVRYISHRVAVMYLGRIVEFGSSEEVYAHPVHPYTVGLMSAVPVTDPDVEKAKTYTRLQGEVSSPVDTKPGCLFANRCPYATERCRQETPGLKKAAHDHFVACHML